MGDWGEAEKTVAPLSSLSGLNIETIQIATAGGHIKKHSEIRPFTRKFICEESRKWAAPHEPRIQARSG